MKLEIFRNIVEPFQEHHVLPRIIEKLFKIFKGSE